MTVVRDFLPACLRSASLPSGTPLGRISTDCSRCVVFCGSKRRDAINTYLVDPIHGAVPRSDYGTICLSLLGDDLEFPDRLDCPPLTWGLTFVLRTPGEVVDVFRLEDARRKERCLLYTVFVFFDASHDDFRPQFGFAFPTCTYKSFDRTFAWHVTVFLSPAYADTFLQISFFCVLQPMFER
jgi:hypothetical protein